MEICFQWVFIQFISPILLVYDTMTKLKKKKIFDKRADVLMNLVFSLFFFKNDFFFYSSSEDFIILHVMTVTDNESNGFGIQFKKKKSVSYLFWENCDVLVERLRRANVAARHRRVSRRARRQLALLEDQSQQRKERMTEKKRKDK